MNEQPVASCESQGFVRQTEQVVLRRLNGRVRSLKLKVRDNELVLRGHARTYYAKQLAQRAAMEFSQLPIIANEIDVS
jgi:hypothetical protein